MKPASKRLKPLFKRHETPVNVERSAPPWCERRLAPVMAKRTLLEAVCFTRLFENMRQIAALCANPKRKRLPALYRLLVTKQTHMGLHPIANKKK
jgi:hypothetical protein